MEVVADRDSGVVLCTSLEMAVSRVVWTSWKGK